MTARRLRLMGAHEIRVRLGGISRQRVYQITTKPHFPKPVADLAQGQVWDAGDVEKWIEANRSPVDEPDGHTLPA